MQIQNAVAFVSGSNRGLGAAIVRALKARGVTKIYAATRSGMTVHEDTIPVQLDITDGAQVRAAAALAQDTTLVFNNAGINNYAPFVGLSDDALVRMEMEVNYFGMLKMCQSFAPVLALNGGGALVNITSIMGRAAIPVCGGASASKAAAVSLTQSVRAQLAKQGTQVYMVAPGALDTDMSANFPGEKADPFVVANFILDSIESDQEDIYPDEMSKAYAALLLSDPKSLERQLSAFV
jgi:NAD(P)-dependent dehydrogenase (short-subunit alcohol dehydrogenase family)